MARTYGTAGGRDGHSVIEALAEAREAGEAGVVRSVIVLPMLMPGLPGVKVIGRNVQGEVTFYTEAPAGDVSAILEAMGGVREITDVVGVLCDDGLSWSDAMDVALATRG